MIATNKLYNQTKDLYVLNQLYYAKTFTESLFGLIPFESLSEHEGLFLPSCSSIHTCFMKFPINCYYLDKNFKIIKIVKNLKPYRFSSGPIIKSKHVLETLSCDNLPLDLGDHLKIMEN